MNKGQPNRHATNGANARVLLEDLLAVGLAPLPMQKVENRDEVVLQLFLDQGNRLRRLFQDGRMRGRDAILLVCSFLWRLWKHTLLYSSH